MKIIICDDNHKDNSHKKDTLINLLKDYEESNNCSLDIIEVKGEDERQRIKNFSFVEGETKLSLDDIIYIETARHKNIFHTKDKDYSIYKKLGDIEEELSEFDFLRVHLSFLVNMKYIEKISSYVLTLTTGQELSVPKSRYQKVKKEYTEYKNTNKNND